MNDTTKRIVALVDGSIYSASVCEHASWLAGRTGAPVELIHVLGRREAPEQADLSGAIRLGARSALMEELAELDARRARLAAERGRAILDDARAIVERAGVPVTARLMHGDLLELLPELEARARVLMIGKRGEAADFARMHLGSNLERILRASHRPVLVTARAFRPIEKVLIAHDGGASARVAVEHVAGSPAFRGLKAHVVTVGQPAERARDWLEPAVARLAEAGIEASSSVLQGEPAPVLGRLVEEAQFDMLVMGAYAHSRLRSLFIGSTTSEMIRTCRVSVLLFRENVKE